MIDKTKKGLEMNLFLNSIALFFSTSTLICCALPALFVFIGAGAALVGLLSSFPVLVTLSKYKMAIFLITGIILTLSFTSMVFSRKLPCPVDTNKEKSCEKLRKFSLIVNFFSLAIFTIGVFFSFFAQFIF